MQSCWSQAAEDRPSFHALLNLIEPLLTDENDYIDLNEFDSNVYYNRDSIDSLEHVTGS